MSADNSLTQKNKERLPGEVLTQIFSHLDLGCLLHSALVCRHWHGFAIARLYHHIYWHWSAHFKIIKAVNKHRHLIRSLEIRSNEPLILEDESALIDALGLPTHLRDVGTRCFPKHPLLMQQRNVATLPRPPSPITESDGPPPITSLTFSGSICSLDFPPIFLFFPCLKHLDIKGNAVMTSLHLGLFLEALPNLEHLKVTRLIVSRENDPSCCRRTPDSYDLDEHNYTTARPKFRLRVLEVEFSFLDWFRNQLLFTRLPHLQELSLLCGAPPVWNRNSGYDYQTQSFSLWLNHCCPELRSIRFEMTADLDFQGPPAAVMLPGLNGDSTTTNNDTWALFQALPQLSVWMRNHLHDHRSCPSRQDLFLNLTTFACIKPNPCSYPSPYIHFARDFLAQLSPTAMRTLTRIDLSAPGGTCYPTCHNDVFRHRRWGIPMQEITPLFSNDLQQLLETCTHLVSFRASGRSIHGHDMLEHPETDPTCHCPSNHNSVAGARMIRPWACEATLQELVIGFRCSQLHVRQNEAVYAQLGRLRVLLRLELSGGSLVPTLEHGMGQMHGMVRLREFEMRHWCWPMPEKSAFQMLIEELPRLKWMRVAVRTGSRLEKELRRWKSGAKGGERVSLQMYTSLMFE